MRSDGNDCQVDYLFRLSIEENENQFNDVRSLSSLKRSCRQRRSVHFAMREA